MEEFVEKSHKFSTIATYNVIQLRGNHQALFQSAFGDELFRHSQSTTTVPRAKISGNISTQFLQLLSTTNTMPARRTQRGEDLRHSLSSTHVNHSKTNQPSRTECTQRRNPTRQLRWNTHESDQNPHETIPTCEKWKRFAPRHSFVNRKRDAPAIKEQPFLLLLLHDSFQLKRERAGEWQKWQRGREKRSKQTAGMDCEDAKFWTESVGNERRPLLPPHHRGLTACQRCPYNSECRKAEGGEKGGSTKGRWRCFWTPPRRLQLGPLSDASNGAFCCCFVHLAPTLFRLSPLAYTIYDPSLYLFNLARILLLWSYDVATGPQLHLLNEKRTKTHTSSEFYFILQYL